MAIKIEAARILPWSQRAFPAKMKKIGIPHKVPTVPEAKGEYPRNPPEAKPLMSQGRGPLCRELKEVPF
jgi:hypothetical protein